jgi:hypothetical protein
MGVDLHRDSARHPDLAPASALEASLAHVNETCSLDPRPIRIKIATST